MELSVVIADLLRGISLEADGFEFCPEVTARLLQRGVAIHGVPISYAPRSWEEEKKIQWYDGLIAVWTLIKHHFSHRGSAIRLNANRQQWVTALTIVGDAKHRF
jgi:hypothetical protein